MKKKALPENYLDNIPVHGEKIVWKVDDNSMVVLELENKGVFNRIAQTLFKKPKISFIHLDELGSFVWKLIDGEKSIMDMGKDVEQQFGEAAKPLYERLAKYFQMLNEYGFITFK